MNNPGGTLVLGGARSGKSRFAENLILATGLKPVYVATAQALDGEMSERIALHRDRRDDRWKTVEEPLALADALRVEAVGNSAVLVDCLTLWLTNLMMAGADIEKECNCLAAFLSEAAMPIVVVSNEVGQGVVPADAMSRTFVDHAGRLHHKIAAVCEAVWFVTAGLPQKLK